MSAQRPSTLSLIILAAVIVAAFAGYRYLTMPDQRSATDKLSDAIRELPNGADKAERQLEDRTPGQKLGDMIKDKTGEQ
ncbi:MAG: hypothetical protein P4M15_04005 [Alphaproteobacteria bacterium]|nr:hypothetical protein [Alphaproteobacteria bacterium]